jgi:hypothetical protein
LEARLEIAGSVELGYLRRTAWHRSRSGIAEADLRRTPWRLVEARFEIAGEVELRGSHVGYLANVRDVCETPGVCTLAGALLLEGGFVPLDVGRAGSLQER